MASTALVAAIARTDGALDFIQVRHEEQAAFMACAHAKYTGEVGVCLATSGPGAIHLLNGLYDAKTDHQPVVAIVGQTASTIALGGSYQQEVDLNALFKDVASEYCHTIANPVAVRHVVDRALRIAMAHAFGHVHHRAERSGRNASRARAPAHPQLRAYAASASARRGSSQQTPTCAMQPRCSTPASVSRCSWEQARNMRTDEVIAVADRLGAGCAKALLGKAVLPDDLPWVTGTIGLLGTTTQLVTSCESATRC